MGDVSGFRVGRDHDQGHAKAVFVGIDNLRRNMIVPAAPVVPRNEDSVFDQYWLVPMALTICATHEGPVPSGTTWVIRRLAGGNHPGQLSELVVRDAGQDLGLIQDDVPSPIGAGADKLTV